MDTCWHSCVKYFIVIFNLLLALAGLAIIGVGAYIQIGAKHYLDFLDSTYLNTPIVFIIVGIVIFLISFFACCGSLSEKSCMVYVYSGLMIVILLAQFGSAIAAFVLKDDLADSIETKMRAGLKNYNKTGYSGVTETWDYVQEELECCGVTNRTDWAGTNLTIPQSCYTQHTHQVFNQGCLSVMEDVFVDNFGYVAAGILGLGVVELTAILLSCYLADRINRMKNYQRLD